MITALGGISLQSIRSLYWIQLIARVLLFVYVYRNLTDIERPSRILKKLDVLKEFGEVFERGTAVKRWLLFQSVSMFTGIMLITFRYPYIYSIKGATPYIIGGVATMMLISEAVFSTVVGRFADKMGRKNSFYILIPLFSLANLLMIYSPTPKWLLLSGFFMGFRMLAGISSGSMTPELVPPECLGRWRGLIDFFSGLACIP
ncbi:unnamed protein product, partial [marine sediment metagenome]